MTREDVIKRIKRILEECKEYNEDDEIAVCYVTPYDADALHMAVKTIEQEPCEDAVSRANLLKQFEDRFIELQKAHRKDLQFGINWCINTLLDAPAVIPVKTGQWVFIDKAHEHATAVQRWTRRKMNEADSFCRRVRGVFLRPRSVGIHADAR